MKLNWIPALLLLPGCGEIDKILKDPEADIPKTCTHVYAPKAYISNWTGSAVDVEMGYMENNKANYVDVQLAAGQSQNVPLRQYSVQEPNYWTTCGSSSTAEVSTKLHLTLNSFSSVKMCALNIRVDWVLLVGLADSCPPYSTEQGMPL